MMYVSLLLGICSAVIGFFILALSVFVAFSLCVPVLQQEEPGLWVTTSQFSQKVNDAVLILQIRKAEVQRYYVTCFGVIMNKSCLCISGFLVCKMGIIVFTFQSYCEGINGHLMRMVYFRNRTIVSFLHSLSSTIQWFLKNGELRIRLNSIGSVYPRC